MICFIKEGHVSGMASTSAYSKYYTFYIDTGMSISLAPPPVIDGVDSDNSNYISEYFEGKEKELLKSAAEYMAIIDLWVEDEITAYKIPITDVYSHKTSIQLSFACHEYESDFFASGEQIVSLYLKQALTQETTELLQKRLCLWKTRYLPNQLIPIDIANIKRIDRETPFGSFTAIGGNLRTDVALYWEKYQLASLEKWKPVIQSAIKSIENKFEVKILPSETSFNNHNIKNAHRVDASWGPVYFTTWFIEEDTRYAEEIKYAISYYIQEQEFSAQLIESLPLDTKEYLNYHKNKEPISPAIRQKMRDEIVKIEKHLLNSFRQFDISVSIKTGESASYPYDWDAVQRLHSNLPLFNRLLNEVNEIGIKMKNNGVSTIEFSNETWDEVPNEKINMTVELNLSKESSRWTIDIHYDELKQKEKEEEFYKILLGEGESDTDDISIEIL